jgi:hypothetical protein
MLHAVPDSNAGHRAAFDPHPASTAAAFILNILPGLLQQAAQWFHNAPLWAAVAKLQKDDTQYRVQ